jgi:hypothetical protein
VKPIKTFGLAVLTALMAMAFVGAGPAMAESTELCGLDPGTESTAPCPEGEAVVSIHEVSVGKARVLTISQIQPEIECNVLFASTQIGTKAGTAGAPLVIKGHFTYTNCECPVKEKSGATTEIKVLREGHETAKVTGKLDISINCLGIFCVYNGTELEGTGKGPLLSTQANGEVTFNEQEVEGSGGFCPSKGKLDITMTPLAPTYIGNGGALHYCVKYDHLHGYYDEDPTCKVIIPTREGFNMLVVGPAGYKVGDHVCAHLASNLIAGLYKDKECKEDDVNNKSLYELGEIVLVQ